MFLSELSRCTRVRCFSSLQSRNLRSLAVSGEATRDTLLEVVLVAKNFILTLCRNGAKQECIQWISLVIQGNKKRLHQSIASQLMYLSMFSVSMETFALQYHGFSFTGFNLNLFWVLLKLLEPVKFNKIIMLDLGYLLSQEASVLLQPLLEESRLCSLEELKHYQDHYRTSAKQQGESKFPTQVFFLAFLALRYLFCPALKELTHLREVLHRKQSENKTQQNDLPGHKCYDDLLTEYMCYTCILGHPSFLASWWHFVNLCLLWLTYLFITDQPFPDDSTQFHENTFVFNGKDDSSRLVALLEKATSESNHSLLDSSSAIFNILPYCMMEDLMEAIRFFLSLPFTHSFASDPIVVPLVKTLPLLNHELLASFSLFIFRSNHIIRNPHCRWSCGYEPLSDLHTHPYFTHRLDQLPCILNGIVPVLIQAFIDAQKDGYYVRIRRRLSYIIHFGKLLEMPCYTESLKDFLHNKETSEIFIRFMAMLVESMTWLLEEGMAALAEIKKKESRKEEKATSHIATTPQNIMEENSMGGSSSENVSDNLDTRQSHEEDDFDPRTFDEARDVSEMPFEQLERLCKGLTDAGLRTLQVVAMVVKLCGNVIIQSSVLLPQVVTCLNCCLENLVGPKGLQLKVSNFQKYNFDPKSLLATLIDIYISLAHFDTEDHKNIAQSICNDSRYFKPSIFQKAYRIASREEFISNKNLDTFLQLIQSLEKYYVHLAAEEEWFSHIWNDIPDEYKDPILDEVMQDPVLLPTSGHIMDRKTIERHLMTEEFDPYNRMPLKSSDLLPQEDLRLRIQEFLNQERAKNLSWSH